MNKQFHFLKNFAFLLLVVCFAFTKCTNNKLGDVSASLMLSTPPFVTLSLDLSRANVSFETNVHASALWVLYRLDNFNNASIVTEQDVAKFSKDASKGVDRSGNKPIQANQDSTAIVELTGLEPHVRYVLFIALEKTSVGIPVIHKRVDFATNCQPYYNYDYDSSICTEARYTCLENGTGRSETIKADADNFLAGNTNGLPEDIIKIHTELNNTNKDAINSSLNNDVLYCEDCNADYKWNVSSTFLINGKSVGTRTCMPCASSSDEICSIEDLDNIRNELNRPGGYALQRPLDFNNPKHYISGSVNTSFTTEEGWQPIANFSISGSAMMMEAKGEPFNTSFNGNGYTISNLYINRSSDFIGLFASIGFGFTADKVFYPVTNANITNLSIEGCNVSGNNNVGCLVGENYGAVITNTSASGRVNGNDSIGGLLGSLIGSTISHNSFNGNVGLVGVNSKIGGGLVGSATISNISHSYSDVTVVGNKRIGGFIGILDNMSVIYNSFSIGTINPRGGTGGNDIGGFVGVTNGNIHSSYSKVNIEESTHLSIGGFAGSVSGGSISYSYSEGNTIGEGQVGGFVGFVSGGSISYSYSIGMVSGSQAGGFVGLVNSGGSINYSYSTGRVNNDNAASGFAGTIAVGSSSVMNNFFDTEISTKNAASAGASGLSTTEMQSACDSNNTMGICVLGTSNFQFAEGQYPKVYQKGTTELVRGQE